MTWNCKEKEKVNAHILQLVWQFANEKEWKKNTVTEDFTEDFTCITHL